MALNCLLTSTTIFCAALPTASMVSPQKRNAAMAPMKAPTSTVGFMSVTWKYAMKSGMEALAGSNAFPAASMNCLPFSAARLMAILISST